LLLPISYKLSTMHINWILLYPGQISGLLSYSVLFLVAHNLYSETLSITFFFFFLFTEIYGDVIVRFTTHVTYAIGFIS
jgi:hypothetical protein